MDNHILDVKTLEEQLRQTEEQHRTIRARLIEARRQPNVSSPATSHADGDSQPVFELSASPSASDGQDGLDFSKSLAVPRSAIPVPTNVPAHHASFLSDQVQNEGRYPSSGHSMKRSRTTHYPEVPVRAAKMTRSTSAMSSPVVTEMRPTRGTLPCTVHTSPVRSYPHPGSEPMPGDYFSRNSICQPANSFVCDSSFTASSLPSQRQPPMETLFENGREMEPSEYISTIPPDAPFVPVPIPSNQVQANRFFQPELMSSCPSSISAPTLPTQPMSRQSSYAFTDNSSISGGLDIGMIRIHSQQSVPGYSQQDGLRQPNGPCPVPIITKRLAYEHDQSFGGMGAHHADLYPSSAPAVAYDHMAMARTHSQGTSASASSPVLPETPVVAYHPQPMERSESARSNQSLKVRAKEVLSRQNQNAARSLQPKPAVQNVRQGLRETPGSLGQTGKTQITKTRYERRKQPKIKCTQCDDYPDGFRGEHELRRHTEAKHKSTVKKWVCVEPQEMTALRPIKPLSGCKQCVANKQYGAYYNAAAHLRRTHFKEKPSRKSSGKHTNGAATNGVGSNTDEKRGGKGGGDWPPISELKLWMKEVHVSSDDPNAFVGDDRSMGPVEHDGTEADGDNSQSFDGSTAVMAHTSDNTVIRYADDSDVAGVGSGFNPDGEIYGDLTLETFQLGYMNGQASERYSFDPTLFVSGSAAPCMHFPSSNPDFGTPIETHPASQSLAATLMGLDGALPVSSAPTMIPTGVGDRHLPPPSTTLAPGDGIDLSFEMVFPMPTQ